MAHYHGVFYGYREYPKVAAVGGRLGILGMLDRVPHAYDVFRDSAADDYGAMLAFTDQSIYIIGQVWGQKALIELSYDGETYQEELEIDPEKNFGSIIRKFAGRGFRIKNKDAGAIARYQVMAFR